jgi:Ubiquitin family
MITLVLKTLSGTQTSISTCESDPISRVFDHCTNWTNVPRGQFRLVSAGRRLEEDGSTVREGGLTDGSEVYVILALRKPVIYLYPHTAMDVSVRLSLTPAWEYSAVYPLTTIKKLELANGQVGQHIEWCVHAKPSGLLRDKLSGRDITYLFWEAECVLDA